MWLELLFVGAVLVLSAAQQTKHPQDGGPNGPGHKKRSRSQVVAMAAVRDYKRAYRDSRRTGTLCATFLDTTVAGELSMLLLAQNVAVSVRDGVCTSWAVLAYQCDPGDVDDTTALKQRLEGRVKSPLALVHCAPARSNKALLYRDLLPAITEASERGAPFRYTAHHHCPSLLIIHTHTHTHTANSLPHSCRPSAGCGCWTRT